jgi:hypothetical protein
VETWTRANDGPGLARLEEHIVRKIRQWRPDVIVTANYGEAGALELFGRGLPPVASGDVTMRYWRPKVTGQQAPVIGFSRHTANFCTGYKLLARISTTYSDERGNEIAHCRLRGTLARAWPSIVARSG